MVDSSATDLTCPKCRNLDRVHMASSYPERFPLLRQPPKGTLAVPFGAFMLAFLLASLPFLAGGVYSHLTEWPSELSAVKALLPKPLLSAAVGVAVLLVAADRPTRAFLLRTGRAAALDARLYGELDLRASSLALAAVSVGFSGFGWGVFLALKSVDSWLVMATPRAFAGPDLMPLGVQGFLAGGLVVLAGFPLMAFIMAWMARAFADYGFFQSGEATPGEFARNLAYPFVLLPLAMALGVGSGLQLLSVLAACWFLAATFVAIRHVVKQSIELALPVALLGAAPVILALFFVTLQVRLNVVNSNWDSFRGRASTLPDLESLWLIGALALAAVLALAALLAAAWTRRKNARARDAWQREDSPWRRLLYCERCGGVHLPNQRDFVPASEVGRLLPWISG